MGHRTPKHPPARQHLRCEYTEAGRVVQCSEGWSVYVVLCEPVAGKFFVKVGASTRVYDRVNTLRTGIPRPIDVVLHTRAGDRRTACILESNIHKAFADKATSGEWFEFDATSADDKALFHGATKHLFEALFRKPLKWERIYPNQLSAYKTQQVRASEKKPDRYAGIRGANRRRRDELRELAAHRRAALDAKK